MIIKKSLVAIAVAIALAGCASLNDAGHAGYTARINAEGCELAVADGKEFKSRTVALDCRAGQFVVTEGESKAFKGEAIAAKAAAVLPVTDLANILAGGGADK
jgi:hypothetical protein